jgi:phosphoribosyl-AMP cyclohydrolase / phosphoribosyl-ATP pyrophosphohydrolase
MNIDTATQLDTVDFEKGGGLLPVVAQHAHTGAILMLGYATRAALERTLAERVMWYWSRSRGALWKKGETSGNVQRLISLHLDCDADAVVARVVPAGPTCHTGEWSCFDAAPTLAALDQVIAERAQEAGETGSYTQRLLRDVNLRLKKLGEEAVELALACDRGDRERVAGEAADLLYHVLVACRGAGVTVEEVLAILDERRSVSATGAAPAAAGRAAAG